MSSRPRMGLHDEMGIGKTATTIGAINHSLSERGIIVCPAMLRENWIKEFKKFSKYPLRLCKGKTVHDYIAWSRNRYDVLIASYEQMTKWTKDFAKTGEYIDFVGFDEAHYLKNIKANRTKALLGDEASGENSLTQWAEHAWHITGTPMANDPLDIYTFLRFCNAIQLDSDEFVRIFFEKRPTTYGARHFVREDMVRDLQALIRNNSIRRTHGDVGMQLPRIWMKEVTISGDTTELDMAAADFPHLEKAIEIAIETGNFKNIKAEYVATLRRLIGKAKAIPYAELLKMELDGGARKRVVFCVHTEPLLYLQKYLRKFGYNFVTVYGDTSERDRQEAVHQFMTNPNVHGFLGNMKVAGVGLTLTESSEIDVFESSWTPADNAQAIKRVHRYGQTNEVHARFITLAESIDEVVNKIVTAKTAAIAEIEGHTMAAAPLDIYTNAA